MDHLEPNPEVDGVAVRLIDSLLSQPNLDNVQAMFVSNVVCDHCPRWQRALLAFIQTGRARRDGEQVDAFELPDLDLWPVEELLSAGIPVAVCCEAATQSGDPMLMDFAFRLLQFWIVGTGKAMCARVI